MTSPTGSPRSRVNRLLNHLLTSGTAGAVLLLGAPALVDAPPAATPPAVETADTTVTLVSAGARHRWPGHPGRRVVRHRVRPGETVTGLAVRYHAWTRELLKINRLSRHSTLYVGRVVRIPVVLAAVPHRAHHRHHARHHAKRHHAKRHHASGTTRSGTTPSGTTPSGTTPSGTTTPRHPWRHSHASRAKVRRVIARTARRHHVSPHTMLAISWQESGWQQRRRSSAGAIGAMQVMPATGRWISLYVGRRLNIYGLRDNVLAGVVLFKVLRGMAPYRRSIGGYYQGLRSIRHRGMYPSTRHYVRNVVAIRRALDRGWRPG